VRWDIDPAMTSMRRHPKSVFYAMTS